MPHLSLQARHLVRDGVRLAVPLALRRGRETRHVRAQREREEMIRVLSPGGVYICSVTVAEAHRRNRAGLSVPYGSGKRTFSAIKMKHTCVDAEMPRSPKLHYREDHAGRSIVVLKRYRDGIWHKWDNTLSFSELRDGAIKSAETIARQRDERTARNRVLIEALQSAGVPIPRPEPLARSTAA